MLVVISDLHFGDGSATENIPARAFDLFLDHVADLASHDGSSRVTLLFLGDVFDLLRTEHWFYPEAGKALEGPAPSLGEPFHLIDRPWATAQVISSPRALTARCQERALQIARKITSPAVCGPQLDILAGRPVHRDAPATAVKDEVLRRRVEGKLQGLQIDRVYVPGNHDRLALVVPGVMAELLRALNARLPNADELVEPGLLRFEGSAVVARHGHEYDDWNFEPVTLGTSTPTAADYERTPLGDLLTTELLARLPYVVRQRLLAAHAGEPPAPGQPPQVPDWVDRVHAHLQGIEDVRPLGAVIRWVVLSGAHVRHVPHAPADEVRAVVDETARELVFRLLRQDYTRAWIRRRLLGSGLWTVVLLHLVWLACKVVPLSWAEWALSSRLVNALLEGGGDRAQARHAAELLDRAGGEHAVLGHTHDYRQIAIRPPGADAAGVFLNSGTWRPRVYATADQKGFRKVSEMTYLVFYDREGTAGEGGGRSYETWTGTKYP